MTIERRRRRSHDPYRALCLQLEHSRIQGAFDAMVLAIDNGLVVAGAGEREICQALGAIAPLLERSRFSGPFPDGLDRDTIEVKKSRLRGELLYVASLGKSDADAWLRRSMQGAERILERV